MRTAAISCPPKLGGAGPQAQRSGKGVCEGVQSESLRCPASSTCEPTPAKTRVKNRPQQKAFRALLRSRLTPAEAKLWTMLKSRQVGGLLFKRQFSVGKYILDFYCASEKLAVELDGEGHFNVIGGVHDEEKNQYVGSRGIRILRFENRVVFEDPNYIVRNILEHAGLDIPHGVESLASPADSLPATLSRSRSPYLRGAVKANRGGAK